MLSGLSDLSHVLSGRKSYNFIINSTHYKQNIKHAKFSTIGIKKRKGISSRINLESKTPKPHVILDYRNKKKKNPIKWGFSKVFLKQFTNVLRTPRYDKIGILEWFCCIRVALPKPFRTTQIVIKIIYTTLNSSIFLFF